MYLAKITTSSGRHELRSENLAELVGRARNCLGVTDWIVLDLERTVRPDSTAHVVMASAHDVIPHCDAAGIPYNDPRAAI